MKKIIFAGGLSGGGKERRMCELIRYLHDIGGYKIWLLSIDDGLQRQTAYDYVQECIEESITLDRKVSRLKTFLQLRSLLNRIEPDVLHDWYGPRLGFYLNPLLIRRRFCYIAGYLADGNKDTFVQNLIMQWSYFHADAIVSNSWAGVRSHKAPCRKSTVIYNGFNQDRVPKNFNPLALKQELGIDGMVVSMAARMDDAKDFFMFLDVAKCVQDRRDDVTFLLVGRGKNELNLKEYAKSLGLHNTKFLGFRQDVIELLMLSDVSLLCSNNDVHAEGVSNSIMEAMACGTPVIATDGGGTPEIIKDGANGYIVKPKDVEAMTTCLLDLLDDEDLKQSMGQNACDTILSQFSIEKMGKQYQMMYEYQK